MRQPTNNFGVLRLIFAAAVIVSHAPQQAHGSRSYDPLLTVFHSVTLGAVSVCGFFLISGYLITQSALKTESISRYSENRIRRIVPAYLVAYALCVFVLAPISGADPLAHMGKIAWRAAFLATPPDLPGMLSGIPIRALNGSMWTIAYEFRCYILVGALAYFGVLKRRKDVLALTGIALVASVALYWIDPGRALDARFERVSIVVGEPSQVLMLTSTFLVGSCVRLYWQEIKDRLTATVALVSTILLGVTLLVAPVAYAGLAIFGGAALFWLALKARLGPIQRINDRWDISYGVYLYGWPSAMALLYFVRNINAWELAGAALLISMALGAASWFLVESPARTRPSTDVERLLAPAE